MHITQHGSQNNVTNKLSNIFAPISDQMLNIWSNCGMGTGQRALGTRDGQWLRLTGIMAFSIAADTEIECRWAGHIINWSAATPQPRHSWAVSISTTLATMECPLSSIPTFLHRLRAWWLSLSRSRYLNFVVILIVLVLPKPSFSVGLELCMCK